jgi:hypothetical protein
VLIALLTMGLSAVRDPAHVCACLGNSDTAIFTWSLSWWPHALLHGINPFVTPDVWAPAGVNVARSTAIPTAAILLSPITELFGAVVSYNVLSIGAPALSAFTAYLLCRRIVRRELPAFAGGYLFGFGAYLYTQLTGHLNFGLVFLVPLMAYLTLRRAQGDMSRRAYVIALAATLIAQAGLSTEVLATTVPFGLILLLAARLLSPRSRRHAIDVLGLETIGAGLLALALTAPFWYYAAIEGGLPTGASNISDIYGLDLLNLVVPTRTTWFGHGVFTTLAATFESNNVAEADGYLSLPIVLAFLFWAFTSRRRFLVRMVVVAVAVGLIAALGAHLHIAGAQTFALPFVLVRDLPVIDFVTPSRLIMLTSLAVSVGVADWLADRSGRTSVRWATVALGAFLLLPNIGSGDWAGRVSNPVFFTSGAYRHYLARGESILAFPFGPGGDSMFWQAETGFYFKMPEGYLGPDTPQPFGSSPVVSQFGGGPHVDVMALLTFLRTYHVRHIVVSGFDDLVIELRQLGFPARMAGDVILITVPPATTPSHPNGTGGTPSPPSTRSATLR